MSGSSGDGHRVDLPAVLADGRRLVRRARLVAATTALASGGLVAILGFGARAMLHPAEAAEEDVVADVSEDSTGTNGEHRVTTSTASTTSTSEPPNGSELVAVPDVVDKTESDAVTTLEDVGFSVVSEPLDVEDVEPGIVVQQDPAAGTEVEAGSTVRLGISEGSELVAVPELVGREQADAEWVLAQAGLSVGDVVEEYSTEQLLGAVIRSEPSGGTEVPAGSSVTLVVSQGPEFVTVPDVEGNAVDLAELRLEEAGLTVGNVVYEHDSSGDVEWYVLRTEPAGGTLVAAGSAVTLVLGCAPYCGIVD